MIRIRSLHINMYRKLAFLFCVTLALVSCKESDVSQASQYVEFRLFSIDHLGNDYLNVTPENMGDFNYNSAFNYVFLLHDENDKGFNNDWYWQVIGKFMKKENYVVIAVDYAKAFKEIPGDKEALIAPLGQRIGEMLVALTKKSISPNRIEIVGHSIGAHIGGVASEYLKNKGNDTVRRIFALDPCELAADNKGNLKKSHAKQVVVIHSSKACIQDAIGHVDFYPNGGESHTECQQRIPYDDHHMAVYYFLCSIIQDCRMYGRICDSIESCGAGKCNSNPTALMGYGIDFNCPQGIYYLFTFCYEMQNKLIRV